MGTPNELTDELNKEISAALTNLKFKAQIAELRGTVFAGSPHDFARLIAKDSEKWGKVIQTANIESGATPFPVLASAVPS
jgi:tripartite-type tricarboxylate transporter receptor subunit TctC